MQEFITLLLLTWRDGFGNLRRHHGIVVAVFVGLLLPAAAITAVIVALFQFT